MSRLRKFWQRQIREVKAGGWPIFTRNVRMLVRRFLFPIGIIASSPLVLLIVAIKPFVLLRFGTMSSDRIGHFIVDVEAYLCARDQQKSRHRTMDIIGCPEPICNRQLQKMWARTMRITPGGWFWSILDRACRIWTRGNVHHVKLYDRKSDYSLFLKTEQHLGFTNEEHRRGRELLEQLGIPPEAPWVCIHNRDAAYLDKALGGRWAYHDYRDFSVQTMVSAAEELSRRGYYVVRVGSIVAEQIISNNTKVIDYASSALRSAFADIYLGAKCSAYIGSDSGISGVPYVFHKPVCFINLSPTLIGNLFGRDIYPCIIKRLWHKEKQRFLSLREMFDDGSAGASESYLFEEAGVEPVCNTSEEIRDLAIEVEERLKGQWQPQPEDEELQNFFWKIFRQYSPVELGEFHINIGASFLRNNKYLLD